MLARGDCVPPEHGLPLKDHGRETPLDIAGAGIVQIASRSVALGAEPAACLSRMDQVVPGIQRSFAMRHLVSV